MQEAARDAKTAEPAKPSPGQSPHASTSAPTPTLTNTAESTKTPAPAKPEADRAERAADGAGADISPRAAPGLGAEPPPPPRPRLAFLKLLIGASVLMGGAYLAFSAYQSHLKSAELQRFIDDRIMRANASIDGGHLKEADALVTELLARQGDNAVALSLRDRIAAIRKEASSQAASARRSLAQRDVTSARRAAEIVRQRDADSAEYVRLNADLVPREQERDRLLEDARRCASNGDRACALTLIERALQVDRESPVKEIWGMVGVQVEPPPAAATPSPAPATRVVTHPPEVAEPSPAPAQRAVARPPVVAPAPSLSLDQEKAVECAAYVRNGRRALQNKAYDQAIASADDALNSLPNCPGARELKTEAEHSLQQARSIPVLN
jgi:tetratricopeptide (TPR) repeat protein